MYSFSLVPLKRFDGGRGQIRVKGGGQRWRCSGKQRAQWISGTPDEETARWNVELICGCHFLFPRCGFRWVEGCLPISLPGSHHLPPHALAQSNLAPLGPLRPPFHSTGKQTCRTTIVNARLQNFTGRCLISSSTGLLLFPLDLVWGSSLCYEPHSPCITSN